MDKRKIYIVAAALILVLAIAAGVTLYLVLKKKTKPPPPPPPPPKENEVFFVYYSPPDKYPNKTDVASWVEGAGGRIATYQDLCQAYSKGSSVCAFGETSGGVVYHMASEYVRDQCMKGQNIGVCKDDNPPQGYFVHGSKPSQGGTISAGGNSYKTADVILPFRTESDKKYWFSEDYISLNKRSDLADGGCDCQRIPPDRAELIMVVTTSAGVGDIIKWATPQGYYPVPKDILCSAYKAGYETCGIPGVSSGTPPGAGALYNEIGQEANPDSKCVKGVCPSQLDPAKDYYGVFIYYIKPANPDDTVNIIGRDFKASDIFYPWSRSKWSKYSPGPASGALKGMSPGYAGDADSDCGCTAPPPPPRGPELFIIKTKKEIPYTDIINWAKKLVGAYPVENSVLCEAYKKGFDVCGPAISYSGDIFTALYNVAQTSGGKKSVCAKKGVCSTTGDYYGVFVYYKKPKKGDKIQFVEGGKSYTVGDDLIYPFNKDKWSFYDAPPFSEINSDCSCS